MKDSEKNENGDGAETKRQFETQDTENKEPSSYNFTNNRKFTDTPNNNGEESQLS